MNISVIGAGISGLATAWKLSDDHNVTLFEKNKKVGGMASTFAYKDFRFDYGPHKIYTTLPGIMDEFRDLVGNELLTISKKNSLRLRGKYFDFPIKFTQLLTRLNPFFGAKCGLGVAKKMVKKEKGSSYEIYFRNNFGDTMYNMLFRDYAWKVWGDPKELSEELARRRVPVGNFLEMVKGIILGADKETSAENFYYPKNGIGTVCDAIMERIEKNGSNAEVETTTKEITIKDNKVESMIVEKNGREKRVKTDYVVSTIPITILPTLIKPAPPKTVLDAAKEMKYRSLIILYLLVDKEKILKQNWIFFPESDYVFNRVSEKKSFSKYMCPEGKTALMVEITCDFNDWRWNASNYDIFELAIYDLEKAGLVKKEEVYDYFTRKARHVYPVYTKEYRRQMNTVLDYLDTIPNLLTTGRQGLFNYNNTDHSIDMANKTATYIKSGRPVEEWRELRKYFDAYKIVD